MTTLDDIRAALGNGADEDAWPPGLSIAEAVARLRERARVPAIPAAEELHAVEEPGPADDDTPSPRWHLRYPPQPPAPAVVAPPLVVEALARYRRCDGPDKLFEAWRVAVLVSSWLP